jgi:hypothetical protein
VVGGDVAHLANGRPRCGAVPDAVAVCFASLALLRLLGRVGDADWSSLLLQRVAVAGARSGDVTEALLDERRLAAGDGLRRSLAAVVDLAAVLVRPRIAGMPVASAAATPAAAMATLRSDPPPWRGSGRGSGACRLRCNEQPCAVIGPTRGCQPSPGTQTVTLVRIEAAHTSQWPTGVRMRPEAYANDLSSSWQLDRRTRLQLGALACDTVKRCSCHPPEMQCRRG